MSTECEFFKKDFNHSYCRRKRGHDYYSPCRYHIILKKLPQFERFSRITGDARIKPGEEGCAKVDLNRCGKIINDCIFKLPFQFPFIKIYQHVVMPDHVHIFIQVKERTEKHLGYYIGMLKGNIAKRFSLLESQPISGDDIFQPGYTDKIIYWGMNFDTIFKYIRENPHRLAMRIQFPEFFRRINKTKIGENLYSVYGNLFLFQNPFKSAVRIHRKNTFQENEILRDEWLRTAEGGGVLVSPFISKAEKKIREEAEALGGKFILIQAEPFPELFKPAKHNFELCCRGCLLIIAPNEPYRNDSFYDTCREMNELAEFIAKS